LEQSSLINEAVRNLKSHHLRGLHLLDLKQVAVQENETAVDNLFIFTIMEINEEIDEAQNESQLRGFRIINHFNL
jgi:DnaJ-domain-containing protein 1